MSEENVACRPVLRFCGRLRSISPAMVAAPRISISALTGERVRKLFDQVDRVYGQFDHRVGTGELNRLLREILQSRSPRVKKSKVPKLFYASQVKTEPPTIVVFVNDPRLFNPSYRRYMEGRIREAFPFPEIPIKLVLRARRPGERP